MKKFLGLAGLLLALTITLELGPIRLAEAAQTCSTTCSSGATLKCTTSSGTCSSSSGTVTCCGQAYSCSTIDSAVAAHNNCMNGCDATADQCMSSCTVFIPCVEDCLTAQRNCHSQCPSLPQTHFFC